MSVCVLLLARVAKKEGPHQCASNVISLTHLSKWQLASPGGGDGVGFREKQVHILYLCLFFHGASSH